MRLALPASARRVPLDDPAEAVREYARIIAELRDAPSGAAADLEPLAAEAVDTAIRTGAFLLAVVAPPDADPALLTAVALEVPEGWTVEVADALRDSLEDTAPDVRQTVLVATGLGPAVIAQRVPGPEQARVGAPMVLQVQGFVPEPGTGRMLVLTLSAPSRRGWTVHQGLFTALVGSASPSGADTRRPSARDPEPDHEPEGDSFEGRTYRL
ncbi:hypothetical protein [Actinokineospora inagensis]|uniref:hypothetical protein n=1 Tax=Actinokineospora inagensis TaxID=103730 RepID=UPI0003F6F964|nr:hypothetical protein [Actinokineospora inagensis]